MAGKYHYTISANYCNVEADDITTLNAKMREMVNDQEFPVLLEQFTSVTKVGHSSVQQAVATVQESMGAQVVTQETVAAPKPPPAPMNATPAASGEGEVETDRWGKKFFYNAPNAPMTPDGRKAVLKDWVSQNGKHLRRWVDPLDGPRSHSYNGPKWEGDWAN